MSAAEESKKQRHDRVRDLLGTRDIDMDEVESEVSGEGGVDGPVGGAEAEKELPGAEAALGGARKVG